MKYFTALYQMPVEGLAAWMAKPAEERESVEKGMMDEWNAWMAAHASQVLKTISLGKTKQVSANGVADAKNGLMLSSYVAAESLEAAADIFKDHPHLKLPGATIEVMETNELGTT